MSFFWPCRPRPPRSPPCPSSIPFSFPTLSVRPPALPSLPAPSPRTYTTPPPHPRPCALRAQIAECGVLRARTHQHDGFTRRDLDTAKSALPPECSRLLEYIACKLAGDQQLAALGISPRHKARVEAEFDILVREKLPRLRAQAAAQVMAKMASKLKYEDGASALNLTAVRRAERFRFRALVVEKGALVKAMGWKQSILQKAPGLSSTHPARRTCPLL